MNLIVYSFILSKMTYVSSLSSLQKLFVYFALPHIASNSSKAALSDSLNADPQPADTECISSLRDDLTVKIQFCNNNLSRPNTQYIVLLDFIVWKRFQYIQHPYTSMLTQGGADCFYEDKTDQQYDFQ